MRFITIALIATVAALRVRQEVTTPQPVEEEEEMPQQPTPAEVFAECDANKDKGLTKKEVKTCAKARMEKMLK